MEDKDRTREQLLNELAGLRRRVADLERSEVERRRMEEALRTSAQEWRSTFDSVEDGIVLMDTEGSIVRCNRAMTSLLGKPFHEIVGRSCHELVYGASEGPRGDSIGGMFEACRRKTFLVKKRDRWVSVAVDPILNEDGHLTGGVCIMSDVSERILAEEMLTRAHEDLEHRVKERTLALSTINERLKAEIESRIETEEALKESEERYKKMVGAVTAYTYSVDLSHAGAITTRHSMGCISITGYNPEDYESDAYLWYKMICPDDKINVENSIKEILAGHKIPPIEHRMVRRDGKVVWVRNTVVPYYGPDGRLLRYDGLIEDITECKRAEEKIQNLNSELKQRVSELTEANKELDAFNYSVSHDLQTPLVAIGGFTRRLLKVCGHKLDEKELDMLNIIKVKTQKMEGLIHDLLSFSRSGRQEIKSVEIDMQDLVRTVIHELKHLPGIGVIRLDIKALPPSCGDISLMKQVFINLLSNAIKFIGSTDPATIEVGCKVAMDENIYYVKDNGIGFSPQSAGELFSPFHRLPGAEEISGSGIGLSIVQRVVNRHGGRAWAEGKVGEGATFYFSLPRIN